MITIQLSRKTAQELFDAAPAHRPEIFSQSQRSYLSLWEPLTG